MKLLLPVANRPSAKARPAARPASGARLTVGLLHNCKPNGDTIIRAAYEALASKGIAAQSLYRVKHTAGEPMKPEILDELRRCDLVMTALAC